LINQHGECSTIARPDRSHVVIDIAPDFVTGTDDATGKVEKIRVVQLWCDPNYPDAWRAQPIRDWIELKARQGFAALIRYSGREAQAVFAPPLTGGAWVEKPRQMATEHEHSAADKAAVIGKVTLVYEQ